MNMAFLRTVATTTTTAIAASAIPAAFAFSSLSSSTSSSPSQSSKSPNSPFSLNPNRFGLVKTFAAPPSPLQMDHNTASQNHHSSLPELLTEYMVDMKCEGCVNAVKNKLQTINVHKFQLWHPTLECSSFMSNWSCQLSAGVKDVEVDLSNQVVRIRGSTPVKTMTEALEQTGRKARLIGQGTPEDFLISAAVSEFKGPDIFGVVRLAQVNMELARIEANFSGLSPGKHGWSINEYGDLTRGAASTGKVYNPTDGEDAKQPLGDLGTLEANEKGEAFYTGVKEKLKVGDLIGRSVVVYATENKSEHGIAAAVIARSAGVGENYKKLCTCDGTTIWEASDRDFVTSKV
ncbi:copper chaperone for superoxide dismutase, chloroplastic/cytosolic isoform X2 [Arachis hypogaea]|uniref:copper chaperone for superoxide dismutase, chloroplastic/cytosolic isoform X2 n=1 Tax=Arachis hypogaea TaxID=3818 RepID=UPI003B2131BA